MHYNNSNDDQLLSALTIYKEKWTIKTDILSTLKTLAPDDDSFTHIVGDVMALGTELKNRNMLNTTDGIENLITYNNVLEKIHYAKHLYNHHTCYKNTMDDGYDYNANIDVSMFKFAPIVFDELKPYQKLLFKMLELLHSKGLRHVGHMCYREITTKSGFSTHAWEPYMTIHEFLHENCNMITDYGNWTLMTSGRDVDKQVVDHLSHTRDQRFPELNKNRNVFAFLNGIYFTNSVEAKGIHKSDELITDLFVNYDTPDFHNLDKNIVACKYFEQDFEQIEDTPYLDSIFNYQKLPADVVEICKMFIGRMLYNVGDLDTWQVIPMYLGSGGSGKSTLIQIMLYIYEHENVGIMGNNYQKTFGLADVYDKFCFIAPEIKRDWGIDQAEFQEIVSGGTLNVNIKHKNSMRVQWRAPGMLGGNENPGFVDNASSIQRRVVVTRFDKKVTDGDPTLHKKLEKEINKILYSCNRLYLQYVNQYARKDIWKVLPNYYLETQQLMAAASNALYAYLGSDILVFGKDYYIPMDEFFKRFNLYCQENNFTRPKINVDFYRAPFAKFELEVQKKSMKYPQRGGRMYKNVQFIIGVDFQLDED